MSLIGSIPRKILPALFLFGVFGAGSTYGYFVHRNELFPRRVLKEAGLAYEALRSAYAHKEPGSFIAYLPEASQGPVTTRIAANQPDEWILVTGGPYEFLEECPTYGCLAWVIDRNGAVIHRWEANLDELLRNFDHVVGKTDPGSFKWVGAELLTDGSLIVAFYNDRAFPEGVGMAKFDRDGRLIWFTKHPIHHWFTVGPDGVIYTAAHSVIDTPAPIGKTRHRITCEQVKARTDHIALIGPDGQLRERIDVMDLLVANGYAGLVRLTTDECDPFHLNFVQYVDGQTAAHLEAVDAGDLLISLRNIYTVLIFSPHTQRIKWIDTGRSIEQHSPRFLPDGSIVVFDNSGGDERLGGSRIVRERVGELDLSVVAPRAGVSLGGDFSSDYAGNINVSADGRRLLVAVTTMSEILEIDLATGAPLWRYDKVFPARSYPGAGRGDDRSVRVEAFGASYVDKAVFAPVFGAPL